MKRFNQILDDILYAVSIVGIAAVLAIWCGMAIKMIKSDVNSPAQTKMVHAEDVY